MLMRVGAGIWSAQRSLRRSRAVRHSAIAALIQFVSQTMRFGSNIILASLLSPAIFGVLGLVTAVRTGMELLSDVGINQSIIVSQHGDEKAFIETAWALQIMRGVVLAAIGALTAFPLAWLYGSEQLGPLLAVGSIASIFAGVARPGPALLQRRRQMNRLFVQRLAQAFSGFGLSVAFALMMPTAMGMVLASITASIAFAVISFAVLPMPGYRPRLDKHYLTSIMSFGKWIFLSSIIYFFAMNFDRLYLPASIPLAIFGVYGIARSLADVIVGTTGQVNQLVLLPAVAGMGKGNRETLARFCKMRFLWLGTVNAGLGVLIACSDIVVTAIFDERYWLATAILPMLLCGAWFAIHAAFCESLLMGLQRPKPMVGSNALRFLVTVCALPIALSTPSLLPAIAVLAVADLPRYVWLSWSVRNTSFSFFWQDPTLFLIAGAMALLMRLALLSVGLIDSFISSVQTESIAQLMMI